MLTMSPVLCSIVGTWHPFPLMDGQGTLVISLAADLAKMLRWLQQSRVRAWSCVESRLQHSAGFLRAGAAFPECQMRIVGVEGQVVATSLAVRSAGSSSSAVTTELREASIACTGPQLLMTGGSLFADFSDNFTGDQHRAPRAPGQAVSRHISSDSSSHADAKGFHVAPAVIAREAVCVPNWVSRSVKNAIQKVTSRQGWP